MIYLLDTNVISQRMVHRPHKGVLHFLDTLQGEQSYLSVITLMEIRAGVEKLATDSKNRHRLEDWLTNYLPKEYRDRILPVSDEIAHAAGHLLAAEKRAARTPDIADILIAATAYVHRLTVVTLNRVHFQHLGIPLEFIVAPEAQH